MKTIKLFVAVAFFFSSAAVIAEKPDPNVPNPPIQVLEHNVDSNGWIAVHEQGTASVDIVDTEELDVNVTGGQVEVSNTVDVSGEVEVTNLPDEQDVYVAAGELSVVTRAYSNLFDWPEGEYVEHEFSEPIYATTIHVSDADEETWIQFYSPLTSGGTPVLNIADPSNINPTYTMSFTYPIPISGFSMYCDNEQYNCTVVMTIFGF